MRQEGGFGRSGEAAGEDGAEKAPRFRLLSEGIQVVLPYVKPDSIIEADVPTLRPMLEMYYPLLNAFGDAFQRKVGEKRVYSLPLLYSPTDDWRRKATGSHVVRFKAGDIEGASCVLTYRLPHTITTV